MWRAEASFDPEGVGPYHEGEAMAAVRARIEGLRGILNAPQKA